MKIIKLLISMAMVLSLVGCGNGEDAPVQTSKPLETADGERFEVDEGLINVKVTLPASFFEMMEEEVTQEELDEEMVGSKMLSATLNEDGSVTYVMNKLVYKELLKEMANSFEESLQELVDDETYTFNKIEHDDKFREFTVICDAAELGFQDVFSVLLFFMMSGYYNGFAGTLDGLVVKVTFVDLEGNVLEDWSSEQLEGETVEEVTDEISSN